MEIPQYPWIRWMQWYMKGIWNLLYYGTARIRLPKGPDFHLLSSPAVFLSSSSPRGFALLGSAVSRKNEASHRVTAIIFCSRPARITVHTHNNECWWLYRNSAGGGRRPYMLPGHQKLSQSLVSGMGPDVYTKTNWPSHVTRGLTRGSGALFLRTVSYDIDKESHK